MPGAILSKDFNSPLPFITSSWAWGCVLFCSGSCQSSPGPTPFLYQNPGILHCFSLTGAQRQRHRKNRWREEHWATMAVMAGEPRVNLLLRAWPMSPQTTPLKCCILPGKSNACGSSSLYHPHQFFALPLLYYLLFQTFCFHYPLPSVIPCKYSSRIISVSCLCLSSHSIAESIIQMLS